MKATNITTNEIVAIKLVKNKKKFTKYQINFQKF